MSKAKRCLSPDCQAEAKTRGLCAGCYGVAMRFVREGKTSEATLEKYGLILPPEKPGRKASNPFARAFAYLKHGSKPATEAGHGSK